eukprot:Gb_19726 [translate_table: standard]
MSRNKSAGPQTCIRSNDHNPSKQFPVSAPSIFLLFVFSSNTMSLEIDPSSGYCNSNGIYYSKGRPAEIPEDDLLDLPTFALSRQHRGRIALVDALTGTQISYPQLTHNVMAIAAGLHGLGVTQGDVVLIVSPNFLHFPVLAMAIMSIGAILSASNPLHSTSEIQKQMEVSMPVLVFTTPELVGKFKGMGVRLVMIGNDEESAKYSCVSSLAKLLRSDPTKKPSVKIHQEDTAVLLYSSGTTGRSKGVVCTHRNLIATVSNFCTVKNMETSCKNVYLCTIPLFHMYGLATFACGLLGIGATVIVLPKFKMEDLLLSIHKYRVTHLSVAPPIVKALSNDHVGGKYDLSSLREVSSGGAPLGRERMESFISHFPGVLILQTYGLTEASGPVTLSDASDGGHHGSVGKLVPSIEAKIVDPDTKKSMPPNKRGELWLRGPTIMKGYHNNKEATSLALDSQSWFRTGDICYIDEEGRTYVVDRLKELIKYKGFQVAPAELEDILLSNPEIADAAVIPYVDEVAGEIPMACIVRKAGSNLREEDVISFVGRQVAPYKKIRRVAFSNSVPRTPSGKIMRRNLRALIQQQHWTRSRL